MIKIDDIIELKTNTKTERLSFATRYFVQINFTFDLTVCSGDLIGTSHLFFRIEQLDKLCSDLATMNKVLSGNTILEDNDSDANVGFQLKQHGQLIVYGQIGGSHEDHFLKFKFQTDQTCIEPFVNDFHNLLKNEEPSNIYEAIDLILWRDWDPIGVNDIAPRDEYQAYTPTIYILKNQGANQEIITKTLYKIETETIGVIGDLERCQKIAEKIIQL